jgi:hypothetical protein
MSETKLEFTQTVGKIKIFYNVLQKKMFTNSKAYVNILRGSPQCFELAYYSKTHRDLSEIVKVQCDFHWQYRVFQKELCNHIPNIIVWRALGWR